MRTLFLALYYGVFTHLPSSYAPVIGPVCNRLRIWCCRHIFARCGKVSTIDRKAYFGNGSGLEIGDYSGLGENCNVPRDIRIGAHVMMAPDVLIINQNHRTTSTDIPMTQQGSEPRRECTIGDDCWIGARVIIVPGACIQEGTIVAAGAVVTRTHPSRSVLGGNPARVIRTR